MKVNPLVLLPGTLFWVLLVFAITTGDPVMIASTVVVGVGTLLGFTITAVRKGSATRERKRQVWAEGAATTATVVSSRTNGSLNGDPYVEMTLSVDGREVAVRQVVSQIMVSKVQPGSRIAVKVDPLDPQLVVVDEALVPNPY